MRGCDSAAGSDLDAVLDFAGVVSDNEGRLHDSGELNVAVGLVLPLELVQQSLVVGLGETGIKQRSSEGRVLQTHFKSISLQTRRGGWDCAPDFPADRDASV